MPLQKRCAVLFFAFLLLCTMGATAYAHEGVDLSKKGSITVNMAYDKKSVPGGELTLYRVGFVAEEDGDYRFVLAEEFSGSGVLLEEIQSDRLAKELADYAGAHGIAGAVSGIGDDGRAVFSDLAAGLYLVVQTKAADGYHGADPFLVSVPMNEEGTYRYDVDASPKVELEKKPVPSEPPAPTEPSSPTSPSGQDIPNTGQLNWPIPVLAVLGLGLFCAGWVLCFGKKKGNSENNER